MNFFKIFIYNIFYLIIKKRAITQNKLHKYFFNNIKYIKKNENISFKNYNRYKIIGVTKSSFLKYYREYKFKYPYYIYFEKLLVVGKINRPPVYLTCQYQAILETTNNSFYCLKNSGAIIEIVKSLFAKKKCLTNIISITGTMTGNAYHWYTEYLPRLQVIYHKLQNQNYSLLLDTNLTSFQSDSLKLLGIPANKIKNWNGKPSIIKNCIIPSLRHEILKTNKFEIHSRDSYSWIRSIILESTEIQNKKHFNIIISRNDSSSRRLINEVKLKEKLTDFNFKIINLSNFEQKEIISFFKYAKIIIGVHGAAFTYSMFSSNAKIVEIFPNNYREKGNKISTHNCLNSFFQISAFLNNYHYVYMAETISDDNFDIKLDIQNFLNFFYKNLI